MHTKLRGFVVLFFLLATLALGQEFRATVTGHVLDQSNAAVPNVTVQVRNLETNEITTAVTDGSGSYTAPFLRPGTFQIVVETRGFKKFIRDNVTLNVGQTAGIDIDLQVGAQTESVTVTAETPVLETEKADRGLVIDELRTKELPLNARNPFMLSLLSAGVNFNGNIIYQRPFDNGAIADWNVNGGWNRNNEFLLDGAPNNAQAGGNNIAYVPPVDSVQEFKIQTNSYDAQYGKTAGGIINVSLKGGTNQLHGTLYEFARRIAWDANSFQNNARGAAKSDHFLDQYGGALGGPIVIPKLYNGKDKSFFFINYEGYREGTPTPLNLSVPAPEFLNGDFSKLVDSSGKRITIYDPATGRDVNGTWVRDAFPNNIIPANRISPVAQKILSYQPKPNQASQGAYYTQNNYFLPGGENLDKDDFYNLVIKFDQNFGSKNRAFFRHASNDRTEIRRTNGVIGAGEDGPLPLKRINDAYVVDWVSTLTPTFIFNLRGSFSRYVEGSRGDGNQGFDITTLGIAPEIARTLPVQGFFGRYDFSDYNSLGRYYGFNYSNTLAVHPSITKIQGAHSIKSGVDMRWIQYNNASVGNPLRLNADRGFTQQTFNQGDANSGNSIASFLIGATNGSFVDYNALPSFLYKYIAPYVQDDWKVSRKLTLNLGLRWDLNYSPVERYNRLNVGFDPTVTSPVNNAIDRSMLPGNPTLKGGLLFAGTAGNSRYPGNLDISTIQPRAGFAYQLTNRIVMRGGWGKYYFNPNNDSQQFNGFSLRTDQVSSLDSARTVNPNTSISNPFGSIVVPPGSSQGPGTFLGRTFTYFDPTFKVPYVNQFSFGFQIDLKQTRLDISYVGNRTHKLETNRAYNEPSLAFRKQCNPLEGGNPAFCDELLANPFYQKAGFEGTSRYSSPTLSRFELNRPFPQFAGIQQNGRNDGKLWYNSLQVTYDVRARGGLNVTMAYTLSKMVEQWGFNDVQANVLQRGLYNADRPHALKASTVYQLPFGKGKRFLNSSNGWSNRIFGGWEYTNIFQWSSGRPLDLASNVWYVKEAGVDPDWSASKIYGVKPCVGQIQNNGSITQLGYSASYGCGPSEYNFLILPRYAPRVSTFRDGRTRIHSTPQWDMSFNKNTRITERTNLQFRAEAFNIMNTFYFPLQQFETNPNNSNFGSIIKGTVAQGNANFPRQIQLALKFTF